MNKKFTVEQCEKTKLFEVVEWTDAVNGTRTGKAVAKFAAEWEANGECEILNVGYEYEMSEIASCEWDPK